ncbi:hypothetical protein [Streptomyces sp. NPDC001933]|uniref:hypothetical protein n=1 Tax=Streptomyces sp. NPDC001933 TaxID=3364626 RepID=UPI003684F634
MESEQGCEDGWRQVLGELDQCGGAGRPDGDVVCGQESGEGGGGDVLAGAGAGEEPVARQVRCPAGGRRLGDEFGQEERDGFGQADIEAFQICKPETGLADG